MVKCLRGAPFDFQGGRHGSWGWVIIIIFFLPPLAAFTDKVFLVVSDALVFFLQKLPFPHWILG